MISPSYPDPTNQPSKTNTGPSMKLRIMSLNYCSLRSQSKRAKLAGLITEH